PGAITGIFYGLNTATGQYEATLTLSAPIDDGRYTLMALPSTLDPDGRALDGDFDGAPGGAFAITFDVKPVPARGPETRVNDSTAGVPRGGEFRVNTYTTGHQTAPAVATDAAGDFVVAWASDGQDGDGYGVYAQRYSAAGVPQGAEFRANTYTTSFQTDPAVAV